MRVNQRTYAACTCWAVGQLGVALVLLGGCIDQLHSQSPPPTAAPSPVITAEAPQPVPNAASSTSILRSPVAISPSPARFPTLGTLSPASATPVSAHGTVFALLMDNRLLAVRAQDGTVLAEHRLTPPPSEENSFTGHFMGLSNDGKHLFVLVPGEPGLADHVAVIDSATAEVDATYALPEQGDLFRSLAVGPTTGRLYLFGNRVEHATSYPPSADAAQRGTPPEAVVVILMDPDTGTTQARWIARKSDGYDWRVYQGAVSADERQLFISYHGPDTTGIDRFDVSDAGLRRCQTATRPNFGCFLTHGGFALYGDGLLAATGEAAILELASDGTIRQGFDMRLNNNHLLEFAVDPHTNRLYAVGSCGYNGGFSAVDLASGGVPDRLTRDGWQWRATPVPPAILVTRDPMRTPYADVPCGERLALGPEPLLVIGKNSRPIPSPGGGALRFLDVETGQIFRTVPTPAEPIDLLVVPSPS